MIRGFRQVSVMATLSRVLGMARDMAFAYLWGRSSLTDLWVVAFMVPNLATRVLGEGGLASSVIPAYMAELQSDRRSAARFAGTLTSFVMVALGLIALLILAGIWIWLTIWPAGHQQRLLVLLMALMLPYMVMAGLAIAFGAILNAHQHFLVPASCSVILNLAILLGLLTGALAKARPETHAVVVATAVVFAGLVQVIMHVNIIRRLQIQVITCWDLHHVRFQQFLRLLLPTLIGLTATQTNVLLNNITAYLATAPATEQQSWILLGQKTVYPLTQGAVSGLYYSQRLYQFPLGVLGIALATAVFPIISRDYCTQGPSAARSTIVEGIKTTIFVAAPASALLLTSARPIVATVFQHGTFSPADTTAVSRTLTCYALGLVAYFLQQVLAKAFYSMPSTQSARIPLYSGLLAILVNIVGSAILIWPLGAAGLALSTAIGAWLQVVIMVYALMTRLPEGLWDGIFPAIIRIAAATIVMAMTSWLLILIGRSLPQTRLVETLWLAVSLAISGAVYISMAWILGLDQVRILLARQVN